MIESNRERVSPDGRISPEAASADAITISQHSRNLKKAKIDLAQNLRQLVRRTCAGPSALNSRFNAIQISNGIEMKISTDRILTTHVGSLPRPDDLFEMMLAKMDGKPVDEKAYAERVRKAVQDSVRQQVDAGLDVVSDGEMGKPSFITYAAAAARRPREARRRAAEPVRQHARDPRLPGILPVGGRRAGQRAPPARPHGLRRSDQVQRPGAAQGRSRHAQGGADEASARPKPSCRRSRRRTSRPRRRTSTTRTRRPTCSPSPRRCARNTRRSSTPASCCRSTIRSSSPTTSRGRTSSIAECRKWAELRVEALNAALAGIPADRDPLPHLLQRQHGAARPRHAAQGHHRHHPQGARRRLFVRGGQSAPRARMGGMEAREAAGRQGADSGRDHAVDRAGRASRSWWRSASAASPTWSAASA